MTGPLAALERAVDDAAWPRALELALAAWRAARDPRLADAVDRIAARCQRPWPPGGKRLHGWWIGRAAAYDPVVAGALLDHVPTRLRANDTTWPAIAARWPDSPVVHAVGEPASGGALNWLDRLAALLSWPDDPRLARVLAAWLVTHIHYLPSSWGERAGRVDALIADRLAALGDVRIVPHLRAHLNVDHDLRSSLAAEPRPSPWQVRMARRFELVEQAAGALAGTPWPWPSVVGSEALAMRLEEPTELERLWARVGEPSDDLASRTVLADALVAAGDSRGLLISLQLAMEGAPEPAPPSDKRAHRVRRLVADEWDRWLGDLAAIVVRDASELRNGMLEVITVGHTFTPRWAWRAVRGHRELLAVHTVRPAIVAPADYAIFVTGLPHLRALTIHEREAARYLAALGTRLPITRLECRLAPHHPRPRPSAAPPPSVRETFELLSRVAPGLTRIALPPGPFLGPERELLAALPAWFPRLEAIDLVSPVPNELRGFEGLPLVRLVQGST